MGECISAAGEVIPPLLIIKGKHIQERWVSHSKLQDDVLLSVSDTGYINDLTTGLAAVFRDLTLSRD